MRIAGVRQNSAPMNLVKNISLFCFETTLQEQGNFLHTKFIRLCLLCQLILNKM